MLGVLVTWHGESVCVFVPSVSCQKGLGVRGPEGLPRLPRAAAENRASGSCSYIRSEQVEPAAGPGAPSSRPTVLTQNRERAVPKALSPWEMPEEKHSPGCRRRWPSPRPRGRHQDLAQLPRREPGPQAPRRRLQCC